MTDNEILPRLTEIFREVFDDQTIVLHPETTADDIPGWDSLSQVTLAVEIKHQLNVKLKSAEMGELRSVRQLVDLIKTRLGATATGSAAYSAV
jgi:acyl carrier protein